ncbi:PREDICTED: DNA ligase 1-like, partial [Rhagoletis zephyria]|uniref:DNA ligase 1-like n=1 Tax=Rhagoletis zephyria TaxID=28612 RepID=UPI0008118CC7
PEEQIRTSSPKVPELPTFTSTTKKPITKPSTTTAKPSLEKLNYNSENEINFEDNKQEEEEEEEQIITTSSSKSPKQTTTKQSSTKSTTSKIEKLNYETENEINFEQEETTRQKVQIKSTSAKLPIFTTEHSTFKTSTTPKTAAEKLDYNTENEMIFEQDENVQKQEQQTETSSSKVSHFTTLTVEKLSTTSTTPKPSLVEKLNYNTENEMNFEQEENTQKNEKQIETSSQKLPIFTPSTEKPIPSTSSTTNLFEKLDFESDQEFDFEQDDAQKQEKQIETASSKVPIFTASTEQSSKVSTTAKPSFKNINFELEKKDNFKQDETQKQKQQTVSTTKKSVKKSSTTTTQQSLEKLNYNTENEMTFEQEENQKQIKTSSSKALKLPISTEQPVYLSPTTSKSPFEKLNYESENEMNFEQDETQKEIRTSSSSKALKQPTTTKKSGTKSTTTSKSSLKKLDYNTQNEMTFGQEESIQKQKEQVETSSPKVPKLPIFPPITEKSIMESPSTTIELFQKLNYDSDEEFNFAEEGKGKSKVDESSSSSDKQSELTKVDTKIADQKSTEKSVEGVEKSNTEKQSSVKGKTAQNLISGEEKSSAFKEKSSTSKVKATKSTTTTKATESPKKEAFKKLDYQSDDSYNFETETAKNNNNNAAVESRSNVNVKTEASTSATAASTNKSNRKSANQQVNVQQSIENHSDLFHQAIDVTGDGAKNTKKKMKKKVVVANKLPSQAKSYSNAFNNFKQRVQTASTADTSSKKAAAVNSAQAI